MIVNKGVGPVIFVKPVDHALFEIRKIFRGAKKRADRSKLSYDLTNNDITYLWERSGGRCEVTGIEFEFEAMEAKHERRPFAPSVDRLDNSIGYTLRNVRLVCVIVNIAMNTWGEHALMRVAVGMFEKGRQNVQHRGLAPATLPEDVRLLMLKKSVKYTARARDLGKEVHLGSFNTVAEALDARLTWARQNSSQKVLRQIFAFTRNSELLNEINVLAGCGLERVKGIEPACPESLEIC